MSTAEGLRSRWHELTTGIKDEVARKWWKIIESNYAESSVRHYHTLVHVADMFEHYDSCKSKLKAPNEVAYAIYFHDLVYDPKSSDENEEGSITLFKRFTREAEIPKESSVYKNVIHLISLTTTHLTEEHKQLDVYGDGDQHYFLDFDMVILGSKSNDYDNYAGKIRQEYSFLSDITYKSLRAKVLKSFLQIPKIFATKEFHEKYESQARSNILREIDQLNSPMAGTFEDNRPDFSNKGK